MNEQIALLAIGLTLVTSVAQADSFDGHQCPGDCLAQQAGYDWAAQNQITDKTSCVSSSYAFNEGCSSYAQGGAGMTWLEIDDDKEEK